MHWPLSKYRYATEVLNIIFRFQRNLFSKSMKMALENTDLSEVDVVVMHALNDKRRHYRI
jgi:hypothetical protein